MRNNENKDKNEKMKKEKGESNSNTDNDNEKGKEVDFLREYVQSCPGISKDSNVLKYLLEDLNKEHEVDMTHDSYDNSLLTDINMSHHVDDENEIEVDDRLDDAEKMRRHVLSCPDVRSDSETMQVVLDAVQQLLSQQPKITLSKKYDNKNKRTKLLSGGVFLRSVLFEMPILFLFLLLVISLGVQRVYQTYWTVIIDNMKWTEERREQESTYYHRVCDATDITTTNILDLRVSTPQQATDLMSTHGANIYTDILSPSTANKLRSFILHHNENLHDSESISVIENKQRWSFGLSPDQHPSVGTALKEIYSHDTFHSSIQQIAGYDPAIVELTAITAAYGSADQHYHPDVMVQASSRGYSRSFAPTYSLFIQLQTTTPEMGATDFCPGTHYCSNDEDRGSQELKFCDSSCIRSATHEHPIQAGTAVLLNQQILHRGSAHVDPNAPARVMFIVTFAPRPRYHASTQLKLQESRMIGHGGSYSLRWDMWGHTFEDMKQPDTQMSFPWNILKSFGLYHTNKVQWGWDYFTVACIRIANADTSFTPYDLQKFIQRGEFGSRLPLCLQKIVYRMNEVLNTVFPPGEEEKKLVQDPSNYWTVEWRTDWGKYIGHNLDQAVSTLTKLYVLAAAFYFLVMTLCFILVIITQKVFSKTKSASTSTRTPTLQVSSKPIQRLFLLHLLVASCGYYISTIHVDNTTWAKDIHSGKLFTSQLTMPIKLQSASPNSLAMKGDTVHPYRHLEYLSSSSSTSSHTVPTKYDVLIGTRFDSPHLASNQYLLNHHPANIFYSKSLSRNLPFHTNYQNIQAPLIRNYYVFQVIQDIISNSAYAGVGVDGDAKRKEGGRVLYQNLYNGHWAALSIPQTAYLIEYEMTIMQNELLGLLDKSLRFLYNECYFGKERETVLMNQYSTKSLDLWYERLLSSFTNKEDDDSDDQKGIRVEKSSSSLSPPTPVFTVSSHAPVILKRFTRPRALSTATKPDTSSNKFYDRKWMQRVKGTSSLHHWLHDINKIQFPLNYKVGDIVEGRYHNKWYKGTIISAKPDETSYTILYKDGDTGTGMLSSQIRPFKTRQVGDIVEAGRDDFYKAKITRVRGNGTLFDIVYQNGVLDHSLKEEHIRRFDINYKVHDSVFARFRGRSKEWFSATITKVYTDGKGSTKYDVLYDDDEVDYGLNLGAIRFM